MVGVFVAVGVGYWLRVSGKNMDWLASMAVAEIPSRDKMLRIANPILLQFRLVWLLFILYSLSSPKNLIHVPVYQCQTIRQKNLNNLVAQSIELLKCFAVREQALFQRISAEHLQRQKANVAYHIFTNTDNYSGIWLRSSKSLLAWIHTRHNIAPAESTSIVSRHK